MGNFLLLNNINKVKKFEESLLETNKTFDTMVDWSVVEPIFSDLLKDYSLELNAMNCLIGVKNDKDFKDKFIQLIKNNNRVIELFPYLLALSKKDKRDISKGTLLVISKNLDKNIYSSYHFCGSLFKNSEANKYYSFITNAGLKDLFQMMMQRDVQDYICGTLVGLDSNGRKNRSGKIFEELCSPIVNKAAKYNNLEVYEQLSSDKIRELFSIKLPKGYINKKLDFFITNKMHTKFINIEVNFYSGEGSKPREIIPSYTDREKKFKRKKIGFCLITDGSC